MRLIGQLKSPYVRRTAIALRYLGIPFESEALSVFSDLERFSAINPLLKAPTLVCDDGTVLMDSTLIIDYLSQSHSTKTSLTPSSDALWLQDVRLNGLALTATDKAVQRVYEDRLRAEDKRDAKWIKRVEGQLENAWKEIDQLLGQWDSTPTDVSLSTGAITTAVAWTFSTHLLPEVISEWLLPNVNQWVATVEALPLFKAFAFPVEE
ncbi:hypothetical protein LMG33818_001939 [Halomonadaceae bacterium LMG 33818]|uniref:glutathione S-transferase family protein n=1 Tax=Cernens ardua TaxID=3402176 RepID=UPI003EDC4F0A